MNVGMMSQSVSHPVSQSVNQWSISQSFSNPFIQHILKIFLETDSDDVYDGDDNGYCYDGLNNSNKVAADR